MWCKKCKILSIFQFSFYFSNTKLNFKIINGPFKWSIYIIVMSYSQPWKSRSKEEEERLRFWVKYFCRGQLVYGLTGTSISTHTQVNQVFSMILMAPLMQMVSTGAHTHTNQVNIHIILDSHYTHHRWVTESSDWEREKKINEWRWASLEIWFEQSDTEKHFIEVLNKLE